MLHALPTALTERFERDGWLLVRNYNDEIGAPYAEAFGTEDRGAVESYCHANAIDYQWQPDGGLRTTQPFTGPREVLVAMADPVHLTDCSP